MSSAVKVRRADPGDAEAIVALAIEVQAFHAAARPDLFQPAGSESVSEVAERVAGGGYLYWVATLDEAVIGYACATVSEEPETRWRRGTRVLRLEQMGVDARHRRHGAGRCLWQAVHGAGTERGVDRVVLNVWAFNEPARRFYERMGLAPFNQRMAFELGAVPSVSDGPA